MAKLNKFTIILFLSLCVWILVASKSIRHHRKHIRCASGYIRCISRRCVVPNPRRGPGRRTCRIWRPIFKCCKKRSTTTEIPPVSSMPFPTANNASGYWNSSMDFSSFPDLMNITLDSSASTTAIPYPTANNTSDYWNSTSDWSSFLNLTNVTLDWPTNTTDTPSPTVSGVMQINIILAPIDCGDGYKLDHFGECRELM